jgi:hypothetical protein
MLVTFKSEAYAHITLFGDVAVRLLKMMGQSGKVPGALLAEDVPEALERLRNAIDAHKALPAVENPGEDDGDEEPAVSLANRALPLIELLEAAAKAGTYVMWDK